MALKQCIECKKEVSTGAKSCPHCGKKDPTQTELKQKASGCLVVIVLLIAFSVYMTFFTEAKEDTTAKMAMDRAISNAVVNEFNQSMNVQAEYYEKYVLTESFPNNLTLSLLENVKSQDQKTLSAFQLTIDKHCTGKDFSYGENRIDANAEYICKHINNEFTSSITDITKSFTWLIEAQDENQKETALAQFKHQMGILKFRFERYQTLIQE